MPFLLERLASALTTPFVVIGGHALQAHGHLRTTLDTDILIAAHSAAELASELETLGLRKLASNDLVWRFAAPSADDSFEEMLDVLLVDAPTFRGILADSTRLDLGGASCQAASLPHLIALKLHAIRQNPDRELRDLADIEALLRLNPGAVTRGQLQDLAARHAPADLIPRVLALLPGQ